ncbi:MAG: hypothetical protein JRJ79_10145 [Deltaproteobacteria bacterium]|nr:hypothetical protein [Deltaproteobacteria bacterium]
MNIPNQLFQIGTFPEDNGFVSVLKQVLVALVTAIKIYGLTGKEPPHHLGKGHKARSKKKIRMIWNEYPRHNRLFGSRAWVLRGVRGNPLDPCHL